MDQLPILLSVGAFVVVVVLVIVYLSIRVVQQYERMVVFRLGKTDESMVRDPGLRFLIPIIDRPVKVDTREQFIEVPSQTTITRDNAPINVDFLIYWRIADPLKSVVNVANFPGALQGVATTTLRAVIGDILLDEVLSKREQINEVLRVKLDEVTERWGGKVTTVEIREITPPRDVQDAMNRQLSAERTRRAVITESEGNRQAAINVAEGQKQSEILKAEGDRQAAILRAEGFSEALTRIFGAAKGIDEKTMALQYLEALKALGNSPATKFVIPTEFTRLVEPLTGYINRGMSRAARAARRSMGVGMSKILVVDDEANVQRLLQYTLKQAGYTVVVAGDGQEALKLWAVGAAGADPARRRAAQARRLRGRRADPRRRGRQGPRADHHADVREGGRAEGPRPARRRGRLPRQAVPPGRAAGPHARPAVALRRRHRRRTRGRPPLGKMIAFYGAKGGVGATTIAINTAIALHSGLDRKVALVDAVLQFGDHRVFLDLGNDRKSVTDLMAVAQADVDLLKSVLVKHDSGVDLLLAPTSPEEADLITPERFAGVLAMLRSIYDYVIVDVDKRLGDLALSILDHADEVHIVMTADLSCLKNVRLVLEALRKVGLRPEAAQARPQPLERVHGRERRRRPRARSSASSRRRSRTSTASRSPPRTRARRSTTRSRTRR